jgi:protein-tyrosine phosphatase
MHGRADIPPGRIDIHSHVLPGIDDGCLDLEESIASIHTLKQHGYVGSICTPHMWPEMYPANNVQNVNALTDVLRREIENAGIDYQLWIGGEVRLFPHVIDWLQAFGVPTLADSNYVLIDLWESGMWPRWVDKAVDWLIEQGYKPILAHPERIGIQKGLEGRLDTLAALGVLLQGNFNCMTGEEGYLADQRIRQYMRENRYTFLAMDMHRPAALPSRIDGMSLVIEEFGEDTLTRLTEINPRRLILADENDE